MILAMVLIDSESPAIRLGETSDKVKASVSKLVFKYMETPKWISDRNENRSIDYGSYLRKTAMINALEIWTVGNNKFGGRMPPEVWVALALEKASCTTPYFSSVLTISI